MIKEGFDPALVRVKEVEVVSPLPKVKAISRPSVVVIVLPESYACCNVTLLTLLVQLAIWLDPFLQSELVPAEPSVSTSRVELKIPAPVTPRVPPRVVAPVPAIKEFWTLTTISPFKLTFPLPVEKVPEPDMVMLLFKVA